MATKNPAVFGRSYDDKNGAVEFNMEENGEVFAKIDLSTIPQEVKDRATARYLGDIVMGSGNAARKADGGTVESARAKMLETIKSLQDGTFTFRSASGQASLSLEEEQGIIADTLVSMGKVPDKETALAKIAALYSKTKTASNGNTTRPDYTALRNIPAIKDALAKAMPGSDEKLDSLLA